MTSARVTGHDALSGEERSGRSVASRATLSGTESAIGTSVGDVVPDGLPSFAATCSAADAAVARAVV
jgi:hypothetical protein